MAGVWARKKSQEVPIQGVIVNDETMESDTDKTLTINAIKRLTQHDNLLINGDFRINQRGQNEYPSGAVKYTVDRWIRMGCAVTVGSDGITLNTVGNSANGAFGQNIETLEVGKKYTVCINITSLSGTGELSIGTRTDFDNVGHSNRLKQGVNKITFTATGQWLTVCCKNVLIAIEYIDLFDGSIAYPHVKEDYAIALMRCQRYYQVYISNTPIRYEYGDEANKYTYLLNPTFQKMRTTPTISRCKYNYYDNNGNNISGDCANEGVYDGFFSLRTSPNNRIQDHCCGVTVNVILDAEIY